MRIGIVSRFPEQHDGLAIYAGRLARELKSQDIDVVTIGDLHSTTADYRIDFLSFSLKKEIARIVAQEHLDALHFEYIAACYGRKTLNLNFLQALSQRVPVMVTLCEVQYAYDGYSLPRRLVLGFLEKRICKKAGRIMVLTARQQDFIRKKYNVKSLDFAPAGIDAKGTAKPGKNLIILGLMNWGKGVEYLLAAKKKLPEYKLLVAGKPVTKEYEQLLRTEAGQGVTLDLRWIPDDVKDKYMKQANIAVYPYVWAPYQSTALNDPLSYGIPVVVSRTGALWEVVDEYGCGVVIEPKSPDAIVRGVQQIAEDFDTYVAGIQRYVRDARWSAVARKHAQAYKKLIQA